MSCEFITGRQGDNADACFAVHAELNKRCVTTNHEQILKEAHDWSLIVTHICYLSRDLYTEELAEKVYIIQLITHSWSTLITKIWIVLLRH